MNEKEKAINDIYNMVLEKEKNLEKNRDNATMGSNRWYELNAKLVATWQIRMLIERYKKHGDFDGETKVIATYTAEDIKKMVNKDEQVRLD